MSKIPKFEKFNEAIVAAGFGPSYMQPYSIATGIPNTGYSMQPVVGHVNNVATGMAEQANMYETNDNSDHTAEAYLKEAKKYLNEAIDKAHESYSATNEGEVNEAMVQIKGKDKPSGAKVLAKLIVAEFYDQKAISSRSVKAWEQEIAELIMNSTF
jgi:hypothetical protein